MIDQAQTPVGDGVFQGRVSAAGVLSASRGITSSAFAAPIFTIELAPDSQADSRVVSLQVSNQDGTNSQPVVTQVDDNTIEVRCVGPAETSVPAGFCIMGTRKAREVSSPP